MREHTHRTKAFFLVWAICALLSAIASGALAQNQVLLPNGWSLSPAGRSVALSGDFAMNLVASPSGKWLAITHNGVGRQSITLVDAQQEKVVDDVTIGKAWLGLAFSQDEKLLYASGGNDNKIVVYAISQNKLVQEPEIILGKPWSDAKETQIWPGGIAVNSSLHLLYVVAKNDSSLYTCDLVTRQVVGKKKLPSVPYTCLYREGKLYISLWGAAKIQVYDTKLDSFTQEYPTDNNPNDMVLSRNGKLLFVANGNDNSVSVIDLVQHKTLETLNAALYPNAPAGSTPNGVSLSRDEKTLYIANADNNCLAVFDVAKPGSSKSLGFIPTGWYPTAVKVIGKKIFVTNGKGFSSYPNPHGPNPMGKRRKRNYQKADSSKPAEVQYIGSLMKSTLSIIDAPTPAQLADYSKAVYQNTPYTKEKETNAQGEAGNPIPHTVGAPSPIKYVFYIIKENRTYDQVLGDIRQGNGDSSLCIFPERITPNLHKLVHDYVLLDNFYVDAEVSADGHNWSTAAYANDYVEKTWPTSYGGRGGNYDFEGQTIAGTPSKGFIWDYCKRAGVSYRTYGEFADDFKPNYATLAGHVCPIYHGWDLDIHDVQREKEWERDFDSLVAAGSVPRFNSLRFGNDHTSGMRKGSFSPYAAVADNDLAVGQFVAHLSQSPIWKESAVFILEDDAQDGSDHVDAHRSTAYVISPFVKPHSVDHTMYSTSGMLRTIELILGLPPMSQYDAAATPLWRCFGSAPNLAAYTLVPSNINLEEKNLAATEGAKKSEQFDFSREDRAPDLALNEVIWKAIKGGNSPMPAPKRGAFVKPIVAKD